MNYYGRFCRSQLYRRIVGYSIDARVTTELAVTALRNAVALRGSAAPVVHSDHRSQFRSHFYQQELRPAGLRGSMGKVGTCADNAAMEPFFSLLQKNVLDRHAGALAPSFASRSSPGSRAPTAAADAKTPSID